MENAADVACRTQSAPGSVATPATSMTRARKIATARQAWSPMSSYIQGNPRLYPIHSSYP